MAAIKGLSKSAEQAKMFAQRYSEVTTALRRSGVPEELAREEARIAATLVFLAPQYLDKAKPCPTCGRKVE